MIKIIKPGKTEFEKTCTKCGCVFSYELSDMQLTNVINCPCCDELLYVPAVIENNNKLPADPSTMLFGQITPDQNNMLFGPSKSGCKNCTWRKEVLNHPDKVYVGDSPCFNCKYWIH